MGVINLNWGFILILVSQVATGLICNKNDTPKITNETEKNRLLSLQYSKNDFEKINSTHYRYCQRTESLIKCCPPGEAYNGMSCVPFSKKISVDYYDTKLRKISHTTLNFSLGLQKNYCASGSLTIDSGEAKGVKNYYILEDNILYLSKGDEAFSYHRDSFCVDNLIRNDLSFVGIVACFVPKMQSELKCNPELTIIAEGKVNNNGDLVSSDYTYGPEYYHQINASFFSVCVCSVRQCLRKCCPIGQRYAGPSNCTSTELPFTANVYDRALNVKTNKPAELFYIVHGDTCTNGQYKLAPEENDYEVNYLLDNGVLYMPNDAKNYTTTDFCVENLGFDDASDIIAACFPVQVDEAPIYPIGFLISLPFLFATLLVYAFLPELRSLHGKNLMCHISSLIVAYIFLSIVQLAAKKINDLFCVVSGFIIQFSFLATFFWLNVMSFDIWLAFSKFRSSNSQGSGKYAFLIYSAYAWGCPSIMLFVTLALHLSPNVPDEIKPGFGDLKCFFQSDLANLGYFYGPIAVILLCNCCLFASTAYQIYVVKKETKVLRAADNRKSNEDNKQRFSMYLKLFLIMGVNWIFEVISWAVKGPKQIWYFTDICNTLQGVIIFLICVGNKKVWRKIKARFGYGSKEETTQNSSMSAASRSSENSSMALTNLDNPQRKISANSQSAKVPFAPNK